LAVGNTFSLPYNAEKILWHDLDGTPANVFGQGYQYLSAGPGDLDYTSRRNGLKDLADLGDHWAVQYEIPRFFALTTTTNWTTGEMYLVAFAASASDVGKTLDVFGCGVNGLDRPNGESIPINAWGSVTEGTWDAAFTSSTALYSTVNRLVKPATDGYVSLYAVEKTSGSMFLLAKYHPSQTQPQFRRYRVTNATVADSGVQSASHNFNTAVHSDIIPEVTSGSAVVVLALVRLRHVPLADPSDILPIDSMQALVFAVRAINAENEKDFALADTLMGKAQTIMGKREEANTMTKGTPVIMDTGYRTSLGRRMNRRILL
jgi:hypothetical protein